MTVSKNEINESQNNYPIVEVSKISVTIQSDFDYRQAFKNIPYVELGKVINADENHVGPYKITLSLLLPKSYIDEIQKKQTINYQIEEEKQMALVEVLETEQVDFSKGLKLIVKENLPFVIMHPQQMYYEYNTIAANQGHPCSYFFYVPIKLINHFETIINNGENLVCIPNCITFQLSIDQNSIDPYKFMQFLERLDKRNRVKVNFENNQCIMKCSIPIDQAVHYYFQFKWQREKIYSIKCPNDTAFINRAHQSYEFFEAMLDENNEEKALALLQSGTISPNECWMGNKIFPLYLAAEKGMSNLVSALLMPQFKTEIDAIGLENQTALLVTCRHAPVNSLFNVFEELLKAGADINHKNDKKENVLDLIIGRIKKELDDDNKEKFKPVINLIREHLNEECKQQLEELEELVPQITSLRI